MSNIKASTDSAIQMKLHTSLAGESAADMSERISWFRDAKFGLFIHWGPASLLGVDLSWGRDGLRPFDITGDTARSVDPIYDVQYQQFNPTEFNAVQWVQMAKDAGMRYLVVVAKHHDGFSMYHTQYSDYSIANTPFQRDIIKELAEACHDGGLKFGVYYSQRDWLHPAYLVGDNREYREFMYNQVQELLTNYGKVDIIWFDSYGTTDMNDPIVHDDLWKPKELLSMIHAAQPGILVNNRLAILGHYDHPSNPDLWCDYNTPEERVGTFQIDRAWESCMTLVGGQWGYKPGGEMYSFEKCIRILVNTVTGDGNLLLNVGPMPTGAIEPRQVERLKEMGDWLAKYGESIYGTRGGPFVSGEWGGSTFVGNTIYVHVLKWDCDSITLPRIPSEIASAELLTGGQVTVTQNKEGVRLVVSPEYQHEIDTIIKLQMAGK